MYAALATINMIVSRDPSTELSLRLAVAAILSCALYLVLGSWFGLPIARWVMNTFFITVWSFLYYDGHLGTITIYFGMTSALITAAELIITDFAWLFVLLRFMAFVFAGMALAQMWPDQKWIDTLVILVESLLL